MSEHAKLNNTCMVYFRATMVILIPVRDPNTSADADPRRLKMLRIRIPTP